MLKFISFGSGSSGNCYLLFTDNDCLMIDCGVGVRALKKHFRQYDLSFQMVKSILLTHDHADHVKAVGSVSKDLAVPVFATELVHNGVEKNWAVHKKVEINYKKVIKKQEEFTIGDFGITPFDVPHDSADCVGYFIRYHQINFVLVTDCGHITDEILSYISKANYLVLEANHEPEKLMAGPYPEHLKRRIIGDNGHLSNEACAQALVKGATPSLRHVWLCHLSDENNHPELARKTIETLLRGNGIIPGADFKMDILKRKTPSEIFELDE